MFKEAIWFNPITQQQELAAKDAKKDANEIPPQRKKLCTVAICAIQLLNRKTPEYNF